MSDERTSATTAPEEKRKNRVRLLAVLLLASLAALLGLQFVPPATATLGPVVISVGGEVGPGRTTIQIPPLGSIEADTHSSPLGISLTVTEIDTNALGRAFADPSGRAELENAIEDDLRVATRRVALQLGLGGVLVAAFLALVLPRRRPSTLAAGALGGVIIMTGVLTGTAATYDVTAFREPRFTGTLERAPEVIDALSRHFGTLDEIRSRYATGAARLSDLLALLAGPLSGPGDGTTAVLHVSDIHSNPVGIQISAALAEQFRVAAVLDTGDLTSFGEPLEAHIGTLIEEMEVPYYFVPGNHDSPANRAAIARVPNVTLVANEVVEISGIRVLGWEDPTFTADNVITTEEGNRIREEEAVVVAEAVAEETPHVLAVHDARMARPSAGLVSLVLAGHTHAQSEVIERGTRFLTVGSTGATGLGSLLAESDLDYEAQILYFRNATPVAVDYVRFRGLGADFQVERRSLVPLELGGPAIDEEEDRDDDEGEAEGEPEPSPRE